MSTISKIAVVIVVILIIFIVSMLLAGYFSDNYGWNVYLNVNDKKDGISFKEYQSGNVTPGSKPRVVYTNDHTLGQLYSAPLGNADISPDKILWTKMHSDEANYPNPTKRTELRRFTTLNGLEEASASIEASGLKINSNAAIIQPGSSVDYNLNVYRKDEPLPKSVIGIKGDTKYRTEGSKYTVFENDGREITTYADGSKRITNKDGSVDRFGPNGDAIKREVTSAAKFGPNGEASVVGYAVAKSAEGFSNLGLDDFNTESFIANSSTGFDKIYANHRSGQSDPSKSTFSLNKSFGGLSKDTFDIDESLTGDENLDIESSIGIVDQTSTNFLYEIEKENIIIDNYDHSDSNGDTGTGSSGTSGSEGFLSSPDKYYVDVAGNQIYRRRRFTANDSFNNWSGPYVDAYGDIHYDGFFEPVYGARTVLNWFLPPERLRSTRITSKITNTWTPHNHKSDVHIEPRYYDSSFNSSIQEVLTETVLRRDPIGNLIIPAQPVFDSLYILE